MWSPKKTTNGNRLQFYDNMRLTSAGDIVFSYYNQKLMQVGTVTHSALSGQKPSEFWLTADYWDEDRWYVTVKWHPIQSPISPKELINEISPLLPLKYSPIDPKTGHGRQVYLAEVSEELSLLLLGKIDKEMLDTLDAEKPDSNDINAVEELEQKIVSAIENDAHIDSTEKEALIKARRGQHIFRKKVQNVETCCRVTKVSAPSLLTASHIKPWRNCSSNKERLDGNNGLLLSKHVDHLFDQGFITFLPDGSIQISSSIDIKQLELLGLSKLKEMNVGAFRDEQIKYLKYHNQNIFLDSAI